VLREGQPPKSLKSGSAATIYNEPFVITQGETMETFLAALAGSLVGGVLAFIGAYWGQKRNFEYLKKSAFQRENEEIKAKIREKAINFLASDNRDHPNGVLDSVEIDRLDSAIDGARRGQFANVRGKISELTRLRIEADKNIMSRESSNKFSKLKKEIFEDLLKITERDIPKV
jgi:hypothetical protein